MRRENCYLSISLVFVLPSDSCNYQLLAITCDFFFSFDSSRSLESRGIFLDISKAFDGVWYDGWLFKSKLNGVNGNLLGLTKSFLRDRDQRATVNGQTSDWKYIRAGVPQGSVLWSLFS